MTSNIAVSVRGLSKAYTIAHEQEKHSTLAETLLQYARNPLRRPACETFWALKDLSFDIRKGDVVGIIGRNGAGKSTLLKVLSRITEPTSGQVDIYGRIGSLLEVGTGFHPELTGRENIFLNGAILGMAKAEIRHQFDEIVAFSGVEEFLDTPVKRYSSGMYVRLAFAVAAHLRADILIVDEVLAVGDAEFQKKCLGKMRDISSTQGRTVLFVSHQMNAVQSLCNQCIGLVKGEVHAIGVPAKVIRSYLGASNVVNWNNESKEHDNPYFKPTRFCLVDQNLHLLQDFTAANECVGVLIEGEVKIIDDALCIGFAVYTLDGILLYWSLHTDKQQEDWPKLIIGKNRLICWLPKHLLNEGEYRIELMTSLHFRAWLCRPEVNAPTIYLKLRGELSSSPHWMEMRPGLLAPILSFRNLAE